ncbi:MAG: ABC transporter permease [Gimesia sp.]|jgi:peptide/nickel transport system permease protein|nr:ABC transporter permease [Litorivicinaceae bacterium]MDF1745705.1 ABC transporter permease [Gimesia sp.]
MSFARIGGVFNNLINQYKIIAENRYGLIGFWIVFFFLVVALFAPWLAPHPPWEMLFANDGSLASLRPPSAEFPAGTTHLGYDLLSQLILATRTTVMIGLISGVISIVIGANVGLIAGYFGGLVDEVLMRITDILYGMPFLPFVIVLISLFGRQIEYVILAIALIVWRTSARVIRAQTISIKQRQFVVAARARGCGDFRIIYRHILPNILPLLLLYTSFNIAWSIVTEASTSFLGFGDGETISWGGMLYELWLSGKTRTAWWWFIAPAACIVALVTSLVFVSRAYEEYANPRLKEEK